jgi:glyoxylase-like metal-dependent hydrolase (beta-lactamase superfamily II)
MVLGATDHLEALFKPDDAPLWERHLALTAFLVRAHGTYFVVDAGLVPHASMPVHVQMAEQALGFDRHAQSDLVSQLKRVGLLNRIEFVVLTHSHGDHAGDLEGLPRVPILLAREDVDWLGGMSTSALETRSWRRLAAWQALQGRLFAVPWAHVAWGPFAKNFDLFGDGSVVLLPTPGHTPGSISLAIPGANGNGAILVGDASLHAQAVRSNSPRGPIQQFTDDNSAVFSQSHRLLHALVRHQPDWDIWPGHDGSLLRHRHGFVDCATALAASVPD